MKIRELMSPDVAACHQDDTLHRAASLMWERDCGSVPVLDAAGSVCGIVTDRDVCMAALTQGKPLHEIPVRSVMATSVHTCGPDDSVETALATMRKNRVRRVPVTESGRLVGMLSLRDLTSALPSWQLGGRSPEVGVEALVETFVVISEPRNGVRAADQRRPREADHRS